MELLRITTPLFSVFLFWLCSSCTESRVKKYSDILEPLVGTAKKERLNEVLGKPTFCKRELAYEQCEYRTSRGRNDPVPEVFRKSEGLGPDLSPYEYFDVLRLYYDDFGVLKEWDAVNIQP